jgi:hypothetical protein
LFPSDRAGDLIGLFGFAVSPSPEVASSAPPAVCSIFGSIPIVHQTSDSDLYGDNGLKGWSQVSPSSPIVVGAVTAAFHDLDIGDNESIDDDEGDRVFGLYS